MNQLTQNILSPICYGLLKDSANHQLLTATPVLPVDATIGYSPNAAQIALFQLNRFPSAGTLVRVSAYEIDATIESIVVTIDNTIAATREGTRVLFYRADTNNLNQVTLQGSVGALNAQSFAAHLGSSLVNQVTMRPGAVVLLQVDLNGNLVLVEGVTGGIEVS